MPDLSDAELLAQWAEGVEAAGSALVRRHIGAVHGFFSRRVPELADDLTQRTFLGCIEGRERLAQLPSFRAYVLGIARKQLLTHFRRQKTRAEEKPDVEQTQLTASRIVGEAREQKLLVRALRTLSVDLQLVCEMYYWEGLKSAEIGEVLEIPASTVTSRLARARELLRERIAELGQDAGLVTTTVENMEAWARSLSAGVRAEADGG